MKVCTFVDTGRERLGFIAGADVVDAPAEYPDMKAFIQSGPDGLRLARDHAAVENLRDRGVIRRAEDLGIDKREATRNLLAARSVRELVRASHGLYSPPKRFRNW